MDIFSTRRRWIRQTLAVALLTPTAWLVPVMDAAATDSNFGDNYLSGDWAGMRSRLADKGIRFDFNYGSELAHNLQGGDKTMTRHAGQLVMEMDLDLQRLWGWHDANFQFAITERDGRNLNTDAKLHELLQSQEIYGRGQTWHLTEMWYGQKYFDHHLEIKLGRLPVGQEFSQFECSFMSLTFCGDQSGNLVGFYWFNYPMSQWAAVGKYNFSSQYYLRTGVYQVDPAYLDKHNAFALNPRGTTGALFPIEIGWTPSFGKDLPGSYVVGAWYTNSHEKDVYTDINGRPAGVTGAGFGMRDGAYGGYITIAQQITHLAGGGTLSGLRVFFNATQADRNTATVDRTIALGGIYRGMFSSRPDDEIGLAFATNHNNSRVADYQRQVNLRSDSQVPLQGSEYVTELFYGIQVKRWLVVRPDLQWVHHPGGSSSYRDAIVGGIKSVIEF